MPSAMKTRYQEEEDTDLKEEGSDEPEPVKNNSVSEKQTPYSRPFDPMADIPTLAHQTNGRELNDVIGKGAESLNDRLKRHCRSCLYAKRIAFARP